MRYDLCIILKVVIDHPIATSLMNHSLSACIYPEMNLAKSIFPEVRFIAWVTEL